MSARASRSSSCRASRAPWAAVTPSTRAVHRAYQDLGVLTGIEQRVLDLGGRADPRERGRGAAPGERGHALAARAAAPDEVAVPVVPDEALEPLVLDGALHAHAFEHAARPRPPAGSSGRAGQLPVEGVLAVGRRSSTARAMLASAAGSPASTSATALPVCSRVRPTRDCRPNSSTASNSRRRRTRVRTRAGTSRARGTLPERRELVPLDEVGRDDPVAPERVVAGGGDGLVDQRVERDRVVADRVPQQRAQRQRVRPALHEPGPVRGVLHAVGEDERLLLARIEGLVAEHRGQRDRQQGGDRAAEEPDAVLLLARRAGVVPGFVVGVEADLGEHGQHPAVAVVRVVVGGRRRQQHPLPDRQPAQPLDGRGVAGARRYRPGRRGVVGLERRVEQRPEAALAGGVVAPDGGVVGVEVGPDGGEADTPAGPPAVPAVDGGEGALLRLGDPVVRRSVSSPSSLHR